MKHQSEFKRIEQSLGRMSSVISVGYGLNESDDFCSSRKSDAVIYGVLYGGMGRKLLEQQDGAVADTWAASDVDVLDDRQQTQ